MFFILRLIFMFSHITFPPQLSASEHFSPLGPCLLMLGILTLLQPAPFQRFPSPAFRLSGKGLSGPHVTDHLFIYFVLKHKKSVLQKVLEARSQNPDIGWATLPPEPLRKDPSLSPQALAAPGNP